MSNVYSEIYSYWNILASVGVYGFKGYIPNGRLGLQENCRMVMALSSLRELWTILLVNALAFTFFS